MKKNSLTNGFQPHMSVRTHYQDIETATDFLKKLPKTVSIPIIFDKMIYSYGDPSFVSVYYTIKPKNKDPKTIWWWPKNAHISFYYTYEPFIDEKTRKKIHDKVINLKEMVLDGFKIMNCNGDFHFWKQML
jgi:hypothetical protein